MAENSIASIKRTVGNFLGFANKSFPIDAEGLTQMQLNEKLLSVLGNIGGNKYILMGCTAATGYAGFVFLATADNPQGELLYLEAGALGTTIYLDKSTVYVSASGYDYNGAYTQRKLVWGVGIENFTWSEFKKLETNAELSAKIAAMQTTIDGIVPEAVGSMKFWAGTVENKPANWLECGGQELLIADYPELFAVIGTTYGAPSQVSFRLPNTKGRVPVGYNVDDNDFKPVGKTNLYTTKTHTLTSLEMPSHTHQLKAAPDSVNGGDYLYGRDGGAAPFETYPAGGGQAHNNLQPYMALPFIIKVK